MTAVTTQWSPVITPRILCLQYTRVGLKVGSLTQQEESYGEIITTTPSYLILAGIKKLKCSLM